jgi:membrane protein
MDQGGRDELSALPRDRRALESAGKGFTLQPWAILVSSWRSVGRQVWTESSKDSLWVVAAGVAFYALLAIFPAVAAVFSIYGLVSEPAEVEQQLRAFEVILPADVVEFLTAEFSRNAARSSGDLGLRFIGSLLITLWSANRGMKALLATVVIAYGEKERGLVAENVLGLLFTLGAIVGLCVALGLLVVLPSIVSFVGLERGTELAVTLLRWPLLFVSLLFGLGILYALAPRRKPPSWRWLTPGAVIATVLWLGGSWLFSIYVTRFGDHAEVYGSLGAAVTLLLWFFVSAYVIALGAEINAILEAIEAKGLPRNEGDPGNERAQISDAAESRP